MLANKYFHLFQMLRNERRSPDSLRRLQTAKLKRLVAHAYAHVPFYRNAFVEAGVHPEQIQSLEDLQLLPVIDKSDFLRVAPRERTDSRMVDRQDLITISTSGSSGKALQFFIDADYEQYRKAQFLRPYISNGRKFRDRGLWVSAHPPQSQQSWFRRWGLLVEKKIYSGSATAEIMRAIQEEQPDIIMGYSSALALTGNYILQEKIPITSPRLIFTDSELLTEATRQSIEAGFGTKVIDIYGTFEFENIAYQCEEHQGYHVTADSVIVEFLKDGMPVKAGEEGEMVCTVLDNFTSPFIRYNIQDIGTYVGNVCPCGRHFPLMRTIAGRSCDLITTGANSTVSSLSLLEKFNHLADRLFEYQIIQQTMEQVVVYVVPRENYRGAEDQRIQNIIHQLLPEADVQVIHTQHIAREKSGKFRPFKSMLTGGGMA